MSNEFIYSVIMVVSVFISSISQILLKKSTEKEYKKAIYEYLNPLVLMGYTLFFGCTLVNVIALRYIPLSMAPILESSGYIFVTVLGYICLKEKISKRKRLGMSIILLGILIFSL